MTLTDFTFDDAPDLTGCTHLKTVTADCTNWVMDNKLGLPILKLRFHPEHALDAVELAQIKGRRFVVSFYAPEGATVKVPETVKDGRARVRERAWERARGTYFDVVD